MVKMCKYWWIYQIRVSEETQIKLGGSEMELSKEDLEKIIKGVTEVIGVKKESKNIKK